jgi:hypothetical protein
MMASCSNQPARNLMGGRLSAISASRLIPDWTHQTLTCMVKDLIR